MRLRFSFVSVWLHKYIVRYGGISVRRTGYLRTSKRKFVTIKNIWFVMCLSVRFIYIMYECLTCVYVSLPSLYSVSIHSLWWISLQSFWYFSVTGLVFCFNSIVVGCWLAFKNKRIEYPSFVCENWKDNFRTIDKGEFKKRKRKTTTMSLAFLDYIE